MKPENLEKLRQLWLRQGKLNPAQRAHLVVSNLVDNPLPAPMHQPYWLREKTPWEEESQWLCRDCSMSTLKLQEFYMVKDEVWKAGGLRRGMLCVLCLEARLRRRLTPADFDHTLIINGEEDPLSKSARLRDRIGLPPEMMTVYPLVDGKFWISPIEYVEADVFREMMVRKYGTQKVKYTGTTLTVYTKVSFNGKNATTEVSLPTSFSAVTKGHSTLPEQGQGR